MNDAPVNTIPTGNHYASSNTATPITGLSIADVDAGSDNVQVTLGLNHGGSITLATSGIAGGLTAGQIATNGTSSVVITAPLAAINATFADPNGVVYKSSAYYNSALEGGFAYNDPAVGIAWPEGLNLSVSARDSAAPALAAIADSLPFEFQ